jgi:hypothetical protein
VATEIVETFADYFEALRWLSSQSTGCLDQRKQSTATKRRLWFSVWLKSKAISPERSLRENRRRYSPKPSQI